MKRRVLGGVVAGTTLATALVLGQGASASVVASADRVPNPPAVLASAEGLSALPGPGASTSASGTAAMQSAGDRAHLGRPKLPKRGARRVPDELLSARRILSEYVARYPILEGTTVEFGDARGYQAISYYQSARIVISSTHTASLDRLIGHEIWHIIDWRDNGQIDWGENVPPR